MKRKQKISNVIASQDGLVNSENDLPLQYVYYPGFYGSFFAFSASENSDLFFCSCSKKSIRNFIRFRIEFNTRLNSNPTKNFIISSAHFPVKIVEELMKSNIKSDSSIYSSLNFRENICHECNRQTPELKYCHPMYGGVFEQSYGWFINKQSFEYGVKPVSFQILDNECPNELFETNTIERTEFISKYNGIEETELLLLKARDSNYQKETRRIRTIIENEVRVKFGFKKVGEAWANETLLYQLVSELYPDRKIYRHFRPEFLEFLELDVYIPDLKLGIEYQGIQHFEPVEHWGGRKALEKVKERDARKKKLCEENGIKLIYFYYYEELDKELICQKINKPSA